MSNFLFFEIKNEINYRKFGRHMRNTLENRGFMPKSRQKMKKSTPIPPKL